MEDIFYGEKKLLHGSGIWLLMMFLPSLWILIVYANMHGWWLIYSA